MEIGALTRPASEGILDLITANRNTGTLEIHQGNGRFNRFDHPVAQSLSVPGGPRALSRLCPGFATRKLGIGEGIENLNAKHNDLFQRRGVGSRDPAGGRHDRRGQRLMPRPFAG